MGNLTDSAFDMEQERRRKKRMERENAERARLARKAADLRLMYGHHASAADTGLSAALLAEIAIEIASEITAACPVPDTTPAPDFSGGCGEFDGGGASGS